MVRISVLARKFRSEDQKLKKKVFSAKSEALSCRSLVFFVLRDFTHPWESISSILGDTGSEMHSSGTGLLLSFEAQPSLGGTYFSLGGGQCLRGTSSDLAGTAPKCPLWRRAAKLHFTDLYSKHRHLLFFDWSEQ